MSLFGFLFDLPTNVLWFCAGLIIGATLSYVGGKNK